MTTAGPTGTGTPADPVNLLAGTEPASAEPAEVPDDQAAPDSVDGVTLTALLDEHAEQRLGPFWLAEIRRACRSRATRYPPAVYARSTSWGPADLEDLVMDTVERILEKNQVEYICATAGDTGHVRALLHRQVAHTLSARRTRTVVDNLLDRAVEDLSGDAYTEDAEPPPGWRRANATAQPDNPPDAEARDVRLLALRLRRLPRLAGDGVERASPVWSAEVLREALADCLDTLGKVTRNVLQQIFTDALTSLVASELVSDDAGSGQTDQGASPEEHALATDAVTRLVDDALDPQERAVLACKFRGWSDADTGKKLGMSRPTVDSRKKSATAKARDALSELPSSAQDAALTALQRRILETDQR